MARCSTRGARTSEAPGVLRFDRALVLVIDTNPVLFRQAAKVITELLGSDLAASRTPPAW